MKGSDKMKVVRFDMHPLPVEINGAPYDSAMDIFKKYDNWNRLVRKDLLASMEKLSFKNIFDKCGA